MEITIQQAVTAHQEGRLEEAERLYRSILENQPTDLGVNNNLGVLLQELGKFDEAETSYRKVIELKPDYAEPHNNLGNTLNKTGRFDEAVASYKKAIELKPDYAEAYYNLGNILKELGRLNEAETSYRETILLKPDSVAAHNNLGVTLQDLGRFDEAETSHRKAISLKSDLAEAHYNLGVTLQDLGRFDEAETSYRKAISLKPDFTKAHYNLGNTLSETGKFDKAEASFRKAIELKPDYTEAHKNLDLLLREKQVMVNIFGPKKSYNNKIKNIDSGSRLIANPFISRREVEKNLISNLYKIRLNQLDKIKGPKTKGPLYGNGKSTLDFRFFENNQSILKNVENDLSKIMKQAVGSEIYIYESFLNIFNSGSGSIPHTHITNFDKTNNLIDQKFSLQYYLSVGDQDCSEPGIFKLDNPDEEILPSNGMVMIIPANRYHSAVYNGKIDRIMIGVNFYSLL